MTPTTLAEELHAIECNIHPTVMGALRPRWQCEVRAAALLALPPDQRAAIAAELLNVELIGRTLETFITGYPAESDRHVEIGTKFLAALLEK